MLVEINLLPQKEAKKYGFFILLACLFVLSLIIAGYFYLQIHSVKTEIENVDRQITVTRNLQERAKQNALNGDSANSLSQLKKAVEWANTYPIQTIPVMRKLTSLLPRRGFIQSFSYTETGVTTVTVQFDAPDDAAYFLDHLNASKWIAEATMTTLTTSDNVNKTDSSAIADAQTNSAAASTNTGSQNDNQPQGQAKDENANSDLNSNDQANSSDTSVQVNNGTRDASGNPNSTSISGNSSTDGYAASSFTAEEKDSQYLPRYLGQFDIKFNKDAIKDLMKNNENNGADVWE